MPNPETPAVPAAIDPPNPAAPAAPAPAAPASTTAAIPASGSPPVAAVAVVDPNAPLIAPPAGPNDWIPNKFHVAKEDGTFDEGASARKLAESYKALESHKGPILEVPKTPEDYKVDGLPDGLKFDEIKADPLYQSFLKGAHAKGMTNDQLSYALTEYFKFVPELFGAAKSVTAQEARADLGKLWADEPTMQRNLAGVTRAINGFATPNPELPGSAQRLFAKYGTDPDFIAFAARVSGEMQEDRLPSGGVPGAPDIEAMQKSKAYWDPNHPEHTATKQRVTEFYNRQHGTR